LRTLDALPPAACAYLIGPGPEAAVASYDRRMVNVARAVDIPPFELEG